MYKRTQVSSDRDYIRFVILAAGAGFVIMAGTILYAVLHGNFRTEGALLLEMSWGLVSLVDIYLGLLIFSFWVLWREQFSIAALVWVFLIISLGNMVSCVYILRACLLADGDMLKFWHGNQSRQEVLS